MNASFSSEQTPRSVSALSSADSSSSHTEPDGRDSLAEIRRDVASLKDTLARLASQAGGEAAKTIRNMGQTMVSQVGSVAGGVADTGSELATAAKEHAKTFTSEIEGMARRNPLGTVAGALVIGVIVGMIARGRG